MTKKIILAILVILAAYIGWKTYQYNKLKAELPSRKTLIQNELKKRQTTYRTTFNKKCVKDYLSKAQEMADSIVFIRANELMLFDSLSRPPKPDKPDLPKVIPLKDSVRVEPLLD